MTFNRRLISNVEVEDVLAWDYPDFCDAYISAADYDGKPMTSEQLEELNEDFAFVHEAAYNQFH